MAKIAVIGAGASGLMAANLITDTQNECTLFESHALPGGCASWFRRQTKVGPCVFDVGATVVPNFLPTTWWHSKLSQWGLLDDLGYQPSRELRFTMDAKKFNLACDSEDFFRTLCAAFPADQEWIIGTLKPVREQILSLQSFIETLPQWPIENVKQVWLNVKNIGATPKSPSNLKLLVTPFDQWLAGHTLSSEFRSWLEMTALISIQCPIADAYAMYALFAILFHSMGSGTFGGGMRRYFELMLKRFRRQDQAIYLPNTKILGIQKNRNGYQLQDQLGHRHGDFKKVFFSCPRQLSEQLIHNTPVQKLSPDMWSAMVIYLVVDDHSTWASDAFNWHIKNSALGEEVFASFSRRGDISRCPPEYRCITMSHHQALDLFWLTAGPADYEKAKAFYSRRMMDALKHATNIDVIHHKEIATPRTWQRYTSRPMGSVGGLPLSQNWTMFKTPRRFLGSQDLIQVGDTSFPGQSLYSCALSAGMAVKAGL